MRTFTTFVHKDAKFRIACPDVELVKQELIKQRKLLEEYIKSHREFAESLEPLSPPLTLSPDTAAGAVLPEAARRMYAASEKTGVGPMAAVAGTMAQLACEAAFKAGISEVIVENGGDIYIYSEEKVIIGLYAGSGKIAGKLAFSIDPASLPLSVCSSSSRMGHSLSFGRCDLACVVSKNASLADAAATRACNDVKEAPDLEKTAAFIQDIDGIEGLLLVKDDKVCISGSLPAIIKHTDSNFGKKITIYDD